ncbi:M28 family peptidase [Simiduia curdlanivorans]|uniref:Carboxypeptidase Q n=1 Tax=Simiduia curdlanivorans TaxID=1492769 RepID=A0ABV8V201_9GAMM|nr:M28 family peptidase [Simiduia curdlanivorans]MDN3640125.1 M28 family peptidase [Simiduia curdlanivorans]
MIRATSIQPLGWLLATSFAVILPLRALAAEAVPSFSKATLAHAETIRLDAPENNHAMKILESLTTEVGPRLAGGPNDARAVAWAKAKFTELGFDQVWLEPVSFPTWQRGVETAEVLSPYPQPLSITALGNSIATPIDGLTANIIEFATLADLEAATKADVTGKIVFINKAMSAHIDGADYGPTVGARSRGASAAAKLGAVGLLIRSIGTDHNRLAHTGYNGYEDGVEKIPAAALSVPDAILLSNMLKRSKPVSVKMNLGSGPGPEYTSYNVIGQINAKRKTNKYVLIGGHLDSWDLGTGAIDDGAGCAVTMAAAEYIARKKLPIEHNIRVVLFANEEQGLFGGNQYRDAHKGDVKNIIAAAESDFGQGPVYALNSRVKPEALPLVQQMQKAMSGLNIQAGHNDGNGGPDLIALGAEGVALFGLALDGTDYFDLHHTANDTFDKVEAKRLNQTATSFAMFAFLAANAPSGFGSGESYLVEKAKSTKH